MSLYALLFSCFSCGYQLILSVHCQTLQATHSWILASFVPCHVVIVQGEVVGSNSVYLLLIARRPMILCSFDLADQGGDDAG